MQDVKDIIVVGTDTHVGKTVVSLLLMQLLHARGYAPQYVKPFQTGCVDPYDTDSDAAFVYAYTPALKGQDPAKAVIHCHRQPKAPYYAARDQGQKIHMAQVVENIDRRRTTDRPLVVEAAGGLMVPLTRTMMVIDLVAMIDCRPLLVARSGLGTINHTLLSIEALRRKDLTPMGVILVDGVDNPADPVLVDENREAIERLGRVPVAGVIPVVNDFDAPPARAYKPLETILFDHRD